MKSFQVHCKWISQSSQLRIEVPQRILFLYVGKTKKDSGILVCFGGKLQAGFDAQNPISLFPISWSLDIEGFFMKYIFKLKNMSF
jgi:hypothetical protein